MNDKNIILENCRKEAFDFYNRMNIVPDKSDIINFMIDELYGNISDNYYVIEQEVLNYLK